MSARRQHPAVTAAADQARAAADDVTAWVRAGYLLGTFAESASTGRPAFPVGERVGDPCGPVAELLARIGRRFDTSELALCQHAAAARAPGLSRQPRPPALYWLSWHPDMLSCPACAAGLPDPASEEDYRCDACGAGQPVGTPMVSVSEIVPAAAERAARTGDTPLPLVCCFGLCQPCAEASGMAL